MKTVVINASEWARGSDPHQESALVLENGTMCCLGICAVKTEMLSKNNLLEYEATAPNTALDALPDCGDNNFFLAWLSVDEFGPANSSHANLAMLVNDTECWGALRVNLQEEPNKKELALFLKLHGQKHRVFLEYYEYYESISDEDRINMLRPIFRERGYRIVFYKDR